MLKFYIPHKHVPVFTLVLVWVIELCRAHKWRFLGVSENPNIWHVLIAYSPAIVALAGSVISEIWCSHLGVTTPEIVAKQARHQTFYIPRILSFQPHTAHSTWHFKLFCALTKLTTYQQTGETCSTALYWPHCHENRKKIKKRINRRIHSRKCWWWGGLRCHR